MNREYKESWREGGRGKGEPKPQRGHENLWKKHLTYLIIQLQDSHIYKENLPVLILK